MTEANPGDRELHLEYSDPFHKKQFRADQTASAIIRTTDDWEDRR